MSPDLCLQQGSYSAAEEICPIFSPVLEHRVNARPGTLKPKQTSFLHVPLNDPSE